MSDYEFVNVLERAGIDDYLALFQKAYGSSDKLTANYVKWLYQDNPHGRAVGVDAFRDGVLAAHYVAIPRIYNVAGAPLRGLLSVNTATHPEHQRRGLFTRLAEETYARAEATGYRFVVGVANANSIHGFSKKLGFDTLGQIRLALLRKPPFYAGRPVLATGSEWLRWRLSNPSRQYFLTPGEAGVSIVNTTQSRASFSLARVANDDIAAAGLRLERKPLRSPLTLTPVFPSDGHGPFLPQRLSPSPWYVILRHLGGPNEALRDLCFDGLAMDTF